MLWAFPQEDPLSRIHGLEVTNDFLGSIYSLVDSPLSPILDYLEPNPLSQLGELWVVRLNVDIQAEFFDTMLHAGPASLHCRQKKPLFDLLALLKPLRTMVLSFSTNEWRHGLATKGAILSRGSHEGKRTLAGQAVEPKGDQNA